MIKILLMMEDTALNAEYVPNVVEGRTVGSVWRGECYDIPTATRVTFNWTNQQMAAVTTLMHGVGEDNDPGYDITTLYVVAEEAIKGWPAVCRPIP